MPSGRPGEGDVRARRPRARSPLTAHAHANLRGRLPNELVEARRALDRTQQVCLLLRTRTDSALSSIWAQANERQSSG